MEQFRALIVRHHIGKSEFIKQYYRVEQQVEKPDEAKNAEDEDADFTKEVQKVTPEVEDVDDGFASAVEGALSAKGIDDKKLMPEKANSSVHSHGEFASAQSKLSQEDCWNEVKVEYVETQSARSGRVSEPTEAPVKKTQKFGDTLQVHDPLEELVKDLET